MDYGLGGMKMDRRNEKELIKMEKDMDYGLLGMRMDRSMKETLMMGNEMD